MSTKATATRSQRLTAVPARLWLVLLLLLPIIGCQRQERYPARPVLLVCPWSAGGGTDRVSRQVAVQLEQELGVPVNVVNATGGGGVTGHTRGAYAGPDGYTLTMITPELNMLHWRGMTGITYDDFEPLMLINRDEAALFVSTDSEWKTLDELTQAIRANPGKLRASGTAFGGIWHLATAGWLEAIGLETTDLNWISINGSAPSLQQLLSGGVEVVCASVPEAQALLDAKKIRCLGVMADERLPDLPDVPTFKDQGIDWTVRGWRGLALPKGVPEDRKQVLLRAVRKVAGSDEYKRFLKQAGFGHALEEPDRFTSALELDDQRYGKMLKREAFRTVQKQRFGPMFFPAILGGLFVVVGGLWLIQKARDPGEEKRTSNIEHSTSNIEPRGDSAPLAPVLGGEGPGVRGQEPRERQAPLTPNPSPPNGGRGETSASRQGLIQFVFALAWIVLYIALAGTLGFVLTTMLLLAAFWIWLGVRWPIALGLAVLLSAGTYQAFAVWLRVPLPWGWLGW